MMLARYDLKLAAQVIQPDLDRLGYASLPASTAGLQSQATLCALVLIDPLRVAKLIEGLPHTPSPGFRGLASGQDDILLEAAKLLSLHGDDRWRHVYKQFLYLWTPGQQDAL